MPIKFERLFTFPSRWTFSIPYVAKLLLQERQPGIWVEPFPGQTPTGAIRPGQPPVGVWHPQQPCLGAIRPGEPPRSGATLATYDALEFLRSLPAGCADGVLYDPPYSIYQNESKYGNVNHAVFDIKYCAATKREARRVLKPGGKAIVFGWNSGGLAGMKFMDTYRVVLLNHGAGRHDTIIVCQIKI